jgi:hypothetical protein
MLAFDMLNITVIKEEVDMEFDRYQKHHRIYIAGIICLFMGICCIALAIFLLPYTIFNLEYSVPLIFFQTADVLQHYFSISDVNAQQGLVYIIIGVGLLLLLIAELISNYIDNELYKIRKAQASAEVIKARSESWQTTLVVLFVIFLVIIGLKLFEWTISAPQA